MPRSTAGSTSISPRHGYEVEYLSHLWGQPALRFGANPDHDEVDEHVTVTTELNDVNPRTTKASF